jgi:hypothetical protein
MVNSPKMMQFGMPAVAGDITGGDNSGGDALEEIMRAALAERGDAAAKPPAGADADPLHALLAAPQTPDGYVIDLPRGHPRDAELEGRARRWFHEAGLPQNLVNGIVREYCRCLAAAPDAGGGDRAAAELARGWGDDRAGEIAGARAVIARCADPTEILALLEESGFGNNPWLIRSLAAFGQLPPGNRPGDALPGSRP